MEDNPFILIAEDDADDRYLLKIAFEETNYHDKLCFVENGVELMNFLINREEAGIQSQMPQFILLDMNMPKKDGHEALYEIKQHDNFKKIPVIVFSTTCSEYEMKRCFDLGAKAYITKPNSFELLLKTVSELKTTALSS